MEPKGRSHVLELRRFLLLLTLATVPAAAAATPADVVFQVLHK